MGEAQLTSEQLKACEELYDLAELIAPTPWEEIVDFLGIKDS